jgi:hypothetical protein
MMDAQTESHLYGQHQAIQTNHCLQIQLVQRIHLNYMIYDLWPFEPWYDVVHELSGTCMLWKIYTVKGMNYRILYRMLTWSAKVYLVLEMSWKRL